MDRKKLTKRTAGIAAAAALTLTATGAAYAATDGGFSSLLERITIYINGKEATEGDYTVMTDENGYTQFALATDNDGKNNVTVTVNPDAALDPDVEYSIDLGTSKLQAQADAIPFTLEAEADKLYLVEANGNRLDITKAAASPEGYLYVWTDKDGNEQKAVALGTPEEHSIVLPLSQSAEAEGNVAFEVE